LIANPFLAILGWILAYLALRTGLRTRDLSISLAGALGMAASLLAIQFHCLDCGATGWAVRARRHHCPAAIDSGRYSGPTLATQLKLWFLLLLAAACYHLVNAAATR
jgi:hypothetical protein